MIMRLIFFPIATCTLFFSLVAINSVHAAEALQVPFKFALGHQKYQKSCAGCHGDALQGTKVGPPLLHPYYRPDHHNDDSFYRAILQGVRAHHWQFGDMPTVPGVTRQDVDAIVPFVRWFQQEKGLF